MSQVKVNDLQAALGRLGSVFKAQSEHMWGSVQGGAAGGVNRLSRRLGARMNAMARSIEQNGVRATLKAPFMNGVHQGAMIGAGLGLTLEGGRQAQDGRFDGRALAGAAFRGGLLGAALGGPLGIGHGLLGAPGRLTKGPMAAATRAAAASRHAAVTGAMRPTMTGNWWSQLEGLAGNAHNRMWGQFEAEAAMGAARRASVERAVMAPIPGPRSGAVSTRWSQAMGPGVPHGTRVAPAPPPVVAARPAPTPVKRATWVSSADRKRNARAAFNALLP